MKTKRETKEVLFIDYIYRISEFDASERLSQEIQSQIVLRNREKQLSQEYSKISSGIRFKLKQFQTNISQLNQSLSQSANNGAM